MDWTLIATVIGTILVPVAAAVLTMHWKISNMLTRLEAVERDHIKRDDDHDCLDKKVDEIKIELARIETKLDMLLTTEK